MSVKNVINPSGKKSVVMVVMGVWEQIITLLEDLEDAEELRQSRTIQEETIPWPQVKAELKLGE